jgi:cytochrome P450
MAMDAEYHDKPEIFDGYRFYNADGNKYAAEGTAPHELAGIEPGNLHWGNGKSTCPGRWYASAVMKLMIGLILTDYDVRFPEGQTERPKDAYLDTMIQPNDKQILWFRKRR